MKKIYFVVVIILAGIFTNGIGIKSAESRENRLKWIDGSGRECSKVCMEKGLFAVVSGTYKGKNNFYVCAAEVGNEGYISGYNLVPAWSEYCVVGFGGQEKKLNTYYCLCSDISAPKAGEHASYHKTKDSMLGQHKEENTDKNISNKQALSLNKTQILAHEKEE
jgi:hypothetical protein